jgi:hypothetical protein
VRRRLILGYAVACLQMYRFAAAELVPIHYRAKAISWVTAGGVAARRDRARASCA